MASTGQTGLFPSKSALESSLKVGAISGISGLFLGSVYGILRSTHPVVFALASGLQWFTLGTAYWTLRDTFLNTWSSKSESHVLASTLAGALCGGGLATITRRNVNILPGSVMFALFGFLGQRSYELLDASHTAHQRPSKLPINTGPQSLLSRIGKSKWSPMKLLDDEEYESILNKKLLSVDAEIAVLDECIEKLRTKTE